MADRPLAGRRIAVTRPAHQAEPVARELEALGATVQVVPLVEIEPIEDLETLRASLHGLDSGDWLVITSANGVAALAGWAELPSLARTVRVAAVGPATAAALRRIGVDPAFVPERYAAEELASGLAPVEGRRVLLVQADSADGRLAEDLRKRGATVDQLHLYHTLQAEAENAELARLRSADAVLLASGSAARSLAAQGGAGGALVVCIGPKTAEVAREVGVEVGLVASEATAQGMIQALVAHFGESE